MTIKFTKQLYNLYRSLIIKLYGFKNVRKIHKIFWITLQHITGRKKFNSKNFKKLIALNDPQINQIIKKLDDKGYLIISENKISSNIKSLHNLIVKTSNDILSKNLKTVGCKSYFQEVEIKNKKSLALFYKYFTNPFFIKTALEYLRDEPLIIAIKLRISKRTSDIYKKLEGSQVWHSDHDDKKMIKVFILLKDINSNSGPLEILNKQTTSKIMKKVNYNWHSETSHSDYLVSENDEFESMTGVKGSIIFADTANCFHRGSRILNEDRLILEANYVSRTSYRFPPINWLIPKFLSKKFLIFSSPFLGQDKKFKFIDSYALNS